MRKKKLMATKKATKLRPNDENNPGTSYPTGYNGTKFPEIKTPLKISTCSNEDVEAIHYDDVVESGVKFKYSDDFQCVYDGTNRVPQMVAMGHSLDSPDATSRYGSEVYRQTQGYHKGPNYKEHSVKDNAAVSAMSTGQVSIHSPISSGINKPGGSIGKPRAGING
jgi:hypothetical protein